MLLLLLSVLKHHHINIAEERGIKAWKASQEFTKALIHLLSAWVSFFLPFAYDSGLFIRKFISKFTWEQIGYASLALLVVYLAYTVYSAILHRKNEIKTVLFNASFYIIAAPLLWYLSVYIPQESWPRVFDIVLIYLPTIQSALVILKVNVLSKKRLSETLTEIERRPYLLLWLSYWSCWPMLDIIASITTTKLASIREINRIFLIIIIWIQYWEGSLLFFQAMDRFFNSIVSTDSALLSHPSIVKYTSMIFGKKANGEDANDEDAAVDAAIENAGRIQTVIGRVTSIYTWIRSNTIPAVFFGSIAAVIIGTILYRVLGVVSGALTFAICVFSAVDSAKVSLKKIDIMYESKLSFWVMLQALTFLSYVPVVGFFIGLWKVRIIEQHGW